MPAKTSPSHETLPFLCSRAVAALPALSCCIQEPLHDGNESALLLARHSSKRARCANHKISANCSMPLVSHPIRPALTVTTPANPSHLCLISSVWRYVLLKVGQDAGGHVLCHLVAVSPATIQRDAIHHLPQQGLHAPIQDTLRVLAPVGSRASKPVLRMMVWWAMMQVCRMTSVSSSKPSIAEMQCLLCAAVGRCQ